MTDKLYALPKVHPMPYGQHAPNYNQVALVYFNRVLLEVYAMGNMRTFWLMLHNVKIDDNFATWEREI